MSHYEIEKISDYSAIYYVLGFAIFGLLLNLALFIKAPVKWLRNASHRRHHHHRHFATYPPSVLLSTVNVAHCFSCCYVILLGYLSFNWRDYHGKKEGDSKGVYVWDSWSEQLKEANSRIEDTKDGIQEPQRWMCLIADVLAGLGYQLSITSLFFAIVTLMALRNNWAENSDLNSQDPERNLIAPRRLNRSESTEPCTGTRRIRGERINGAVLQTSTNSSGSTKQIWLEMIFCSLAWVISLILALIPVLPINSHSQLDYPSAICHGLGYLVEHRPGWQYIFGVYVCFDGALLLIASVLAVVELTRSKCCSVSDSIMNLRRNALLKDTAVLTFVNFGLWVPTVYFGK